MTAPARGQATGIPLVPSEHPPAPKGPPGWPRPDPAALFPLFPGHGTDPALPTTLPSGSLPQPHGVEKPEPCPEATGAPPCPTAWPRVQPGGHLSPHRTKTRTPPRAAPSKTSLLVPAPLGPIALPQSARTPRAPARGSQLLSRGGQQLSGCLSPPPFLAPQPLLQAGAEPKPGWEGQEGSYGVGGARSSFSNPPHFMHPAPFHPRHLLAPQPQPSPARAPHEAPRGAASPLPCQRGEGRARPPSPGPKRDPEMPPLCAQGHAPVPGRFAPLPPGALPSRASGRARGCCVSPRLSARSRRVAASTGSSRSSLLPAEPPRTGMEKRAQRRAARGCWWPRAGGQREAQR